jgi:signal transduction histidine kinase/CheY-like chemotaxis protein/HAMP domain-containing protein
MQIKLFLAFGALIFLILVLVAVTVIPKFRLSDQYNAMIHSSIERQTYLVNAMADMNRMRYADLTKGYMAEEDSFIAIFSGIYENYATYAESFIENINSYCILLHAMPNITREERQERLDIADEIIILFSDYQKMTAALNEYAINGDTEQAFDCIEELVPLGNKLGELVQLLHDKSFQFIEQKSLETMMEAGKLVNIVTVILAIGLFLSIFVSIFVTRNIRTPIAEIEIAMNEISNGNLNYPIRSKYNDELGILSHHIGDMVETISEMNKTMAVMDFMDTMLYIADMDYKLLYVNSRLTHTYQMDRENWTNQKCYKAIRNLDKPCVFCQLRKFLPTKGSFPSQNYASIWDDTIKAWLGSSTAIIRWVDGSTAHFHSLTDETLKKTHEEQLREADEYTQLMLDTLPMCCQLWDKNLRIIACNEETVRHYGVSSKQEYIEKYHEFSPEFQPCGVHSQEMSNEYVKQAFEEGYCCFEWMHQDVNGEQIPSEITLVRIKYKGDYIVAGYTRDLRELKAMLSGMHEAEKDLRIARDAAEAANKAKSVFLANMSHEIRTPMNSIVGFSELALDSEISPKSRDYFNGILENADWLLQIINNILDLSKIESGRLELEHIPFDLHEIFAHCQTTIMPKALEKGIIMHFYAEPSVGYRLLGDPTRLRQVMLNLLSNAVKFTDAGSVKVLASIVQSDERRVTLHFGIKDSGIGMTPEQISKIFEPFTQADTSTTRKFGGTGLGLPISKNIIEQMGGALSVESTPGLGTTFSFELTFDATDSADDISDSQTTIKQFEKPYFKGEILVCEDNIMNQRVICEHLERVGLQTVIATNGKEGVDMVLKRIESGTKPFDLIFMDMHMPIMDGFEAASEIVKFNTGTPIVALTANIMANEKELYKTSGINDYMGKPFTTNDLWSCLLKYLKPIEEHSIQGKQYNNKVEEALNTQLRIDFANGNQATFADIANALDSGDIKQAHRLAHTLKSNAGLIKKPKLQKISADIEYMLKDGENNVPANYMNALKTELDTVLEELSPLLSKQEVPTQSTTLSTKEVIKLLERLEPLIKSGNPNCIEMIDELRAVPETELLVKQIEDFDFKPALATFERQKRKWIQENG